MGVEVRLGSGAGVWTESSGRWCSSRFGAVSTIPARGYGEQEDRPEERGGPRGVRSASAQWLLGVFRVPASSTGLSTARRASVRGNVTARRYRPRVDADALLVGLDEQQRAAVVSEAAPLAVLAGAGAGKTRVLTRRIAWQAATGRLDAAHVLAVTFTRRAAGELCDRLARLAVRPRVTAGTLHALCLAQLRARAAERGRAAPNLLERKARLLVPLVMVRGAEARVVASELAGEIEWAKARLVPPDGYEAAVTLAGEL